MTTMTSPAVRVTGGVDTHRDIHVAAALDQIGDCWAATGAQRTYVLSVVDQGNGKPPTLLYESWRTGNPSENTFPVQYDTWLATVRFVK